MMTQPKARNDLPPQIAEEFRKLLHHLRPAYYLKKLLNGILLRHEVDALRDAGIDVGDPEDAWPTTLTIVRTVALRRKLTIERAVLELTRSLDIIGTGKYERLRKAIGEPVVPERNDVPQWDAEARILYYKSQQIREVSPRAKGAIAILSAFEEDGWPTRIDIPFDNAAQSREAVRVLNEQLMAIKFHSDGTGEGIYWQDVT